MCGGRTGTPRVHPAARGRPRAASRVCTPRAVVSRTVTDCPNCGEQVDESQALCSNCGFDLHTQAADEVRRLREEGRIHPGRLGPRERGETTQPLKGSGEQRPAEELPDEPEPFGAGL